MATRRREKKKKSNYGLLIGSAISTTVIVLIAAVMYFEMQPGAGDRLSGTITEATLAEQSLQTDGLPSFGELTNPSGNSGSLDQLLAQIADGKLVLNAGGYEDEKPVRAGLIVDALQAAAVGTIPADALDAKIPAKRFESRELKEDWQALGKAVRMQVDSHVEQGQFDRGLAVGVSYLTFGQQVFERNTRLKTRQRGLAMMRSALSTLGRVHRARFEDGAIDKEQSLKLNEDLAAWSEAIKAVEDVWNRKLGSIESVTEPNIADIIKVANEDADLTFRAFAALRLGYALYERGEPGNQKMIKEAMEALKSDSDKLVAKLAAEAAAIERSEYHELRK